MKDSLVEIGDEGVGVGHLLWASIGEGGRWKNRGMGSVIFSWKISGKGSLEKPGNGVVGKTGERVIAINFPNLFDNNGKVTFIDKMEVLRELTDSLLTILD
ncbi:hypothetical protein L6452_37049 [Arctium lappa]|uniref:Uncharacterized protein n=1 Tax=Arctium lappa TaxID=4217 RepID=A0ACB8Y322_ARCLA|nr:hypothetical protein L6452_37049 [Arctium lappa]